MKAIVCKAWGLPETLVIEDQADLVPAAGNCYRHHGSRCEFS